MQALGNKEKSLSGWKVYWDVSKNESDERENRRRYLGLDVFISCYRSNACLVMDSLEFFLSMRGIESFLSL